MSELAGAINSGDVGEPFCWEKDCYILFSVDGTLLHSGTIFWRISFSNFANKYCAKNFWPSAKSNPGPWWKHFIKKKLSSELVSPGKTIFYLCVLLAALRCFYSFWNVIPVWGFFLIGYSNLYFHNNCSI